MQRRTRGSDSIKFLFLRCGKGISREILSKHASLQAVDAGLFYGAGHAEVALREALKAFKNNENLSREIYTEVVVRASGQRHIKKAFEMFGLKNSREILLMGKNTKEMEKFIREVEGKEFEVKMDKKIVERLRRVFNISETELSASPLKSEEETIKAIINERIALIPVL